MAQFGSKAPFAEPPWYLHGDHPSYTASHCKLRAITRNYVDNELRHHAQEWEESGEVPSSVYNRHATLGYLVPLPPVQQYMGSVKLPAGILPDEWDEFHTLVMVDELSRIGYWGVNLALGQANTLVCPVILRFGTEEQKNFYLPRLASGVIRFSYAVTEPEVGSDVANICTTGRRQGNFYIVEGVKKWVTNGLFAHFCLVAVRTGGSGHGGISLLIVSLDAPGVSKKRIDVSGVRASGSAMIEFDSVSVPLGNLVGMENDGFSMMMSNFNQERLVLSCAALRLSRVCAQDAYEHSIGRKTFGQKLISHAIIRAKVAQFGIDIEPAFSLLEQLTSVIKNSRIRGEDEKSMGGMTALLKVASMRTLERCVREAQQVMGGIGYSKQGRGERVEQISRDLRMLVVGGGSEEIMVGLTLRQHLRDIGRFSQKSSKL